MVFNATAEAITFLATGKEASSDTLDASLPEDASDIDILKNNEPKPRNDRKKGFFEFETEIKWLYVFVFTLLHAIAVYGIFTLPWLKSWRTIIFTIVYGIAHSFGVTGGAHRLWTHRSYKAKTPLRIILMILFVASGQNSIYQWVRDHRVHHKYSETNADPHNSNRGFFFSHIGWLMLKKHPEVIKKGQQIDMSDIENDPVVAFSEKYLIPMRFMLCFVIPTVIPVYFWNEDWRTSFFSQIVRYVFALNGTWCINSVCHMFGTKPYDKNIAPVENKIMGYLGIGEGWHNYHHAFPWDYRASEYGSWRANLTGDLIELFAKIGWAYDLKSPSKSLLKSIIIKRGDGTHVESRKQVFSDKSTNN